MNKFLWLWSVRLAVAFALVVIMSRVDGAELRGFGPVTSEPLKLDPGLEGFLFVCKDPDHATTLMEKLGHDMEQSCTVTPVWQSVTLGGHGYSVLVRPGLGAFLLATNGEKVFAITSSKTDQLDAAFAGAVQTLGEAHGFDPQFQYPMYLDKFTTHGIGSWYPSYWDDANTKGKPNTIDDHFQFAQKYDLVLQPSAGGYQLRNLLPKLHQYDRPYHFAQWHEWSPSLALLCPDDLVLPGTDFSTSPSYYGEVSFGGKQLEAFRNWTFEQSMKELKDDPNLVDWLEPHGEIGPFHDHFYWDYSENNRLAMVNYLQQERHYTLASLGEAWFGDKDRFHSWADVGIPMNYDFYGRQPDSIMADRVWRLHTATLDDGCKLGYQNDHFDDAKWVTFPMPGGEVSSMIRRGAKLMWYRGTLTVPEKWLGEHRGKGRIYLNAATLTESRGWKNPDKVWFNGQEVGALFTAPGNTNAAQIDVTEIIRPGVNNIAFLPTNERFGFPGTFFLATKPMESYPFSDSNLNARYFDWSEYVSWVLNNDVADTLKAMRAIDPDRPIKVHAASDKDLMGRIMEKYGCYGHNTGEGSFLRAWDRRLGYPRGTRASAEFGGSITTEVGLKRFLGFFTFEGLNALDNFHNIQAMMYTPATPVWEEYMPYFKMAPHREIKKPDIALLWSSKNNKLLERNLPMIYDLGRGDLQSIGYSYVYLDELGLEDGLAKDYPVVWDAYSELMSPETVAQIKAYVEAGGTFVALQETGRSTFTKKDAWPISDLTGFAVREVRPMEGSVTIMRDQPLFKNLAGKTFYNRGKCIDYSDYNFADKCVVLDPVAPGTQAIARYKDGAIAIGMRKLGKGRVIVLGSPFWRDSYDNSGLWTPGEGQSVFLEDLLAGLGLKPLATADNHDIWREHYVATNGTEEYLALWNPTDTEKTTTFEWTTVKPAGSLFDPKNGQAIPGQIDGNKVRLENLKLAPYETLIVATQSVQPPQNSLSDWFAELSRTWQPSAKGEFVPRPDLPFYESEVREGTTSRVLSAEEAAHLDLSALASGVDPGAGWDSKLGFIRPENLNLKLEPSQKIAYRCPMTLPKEWKAGDTYSLVFKPYWRDNLLVNAFFNGKPVLSVDKGGTKDASVDITSLISFDKPNWLAFTTPSTGFMGVIQIVRRPKVAESMEVTGAWQVQGDEDSGVSTVTLPGKMQGLFAQKKDIVIPAAWSKSRVFIEIQPSQIADYNAFAINDKMVLHPLAYFAAVTYMDITPWVKFGQANTLTLVPAKPARNWEPGPLTINHITLERVPNR
jgi:hypothetical protein